MKNYIFKNTYDKYNYRYFKSRWILNWMEYTAKMFEQVSVSLFVHWNTILVGIFVPTLQKGRKAFLPICSCSTGLNRVRCLRGNISRWSNISPRWWIWWSQFFWRAYYAPCAGAFGAGVGYDPDGAGAIPFSIFVSSQPLNNEKYVLEYVHVLECMCQISNCCPVFLWSVHNIQEQ